MKPAKSSLLVVAVIGAGLSLSFAPVRADELPEDTNKIKSLTVEQAQKLVEKNRSNELHFADLTQLDADVAKVLAEFKGGDLSLSGLTTLDAETAKVLAGSKAWNGVLPNLTTLEVDTAEALAEFKGKLLLLDGLTTLDADAAKALAASQKWNGQLPNLMTLDTTDSIAIAQALATRKGPLKLPNLKKISPKTLTALIQKADVEIPRIETLELIQEPDGSATENFIIPEGFKQQSR